MPLKTPFPLTLKRSAAHLLAVWMATAVFGSDADSPASYAEWLENYPDLSLSERYAMANPSGDGIPNSFKFALNMDPQLPGRADMPSPVLQDSPLGQYLVLDVPLNETAVADGRLGWKIHRLDESWTDGERSDQALPGSAAWYSSLGPNTLTSEAGSMNQTLPGTHTQVVAYITEPGEKVALEIGETLRLHFKVSFLGTDYTSLGFVRFGLFDTSMNPRLSGDGQGHANTHFSNSTGYVCTLNDFRAGSKVYFRNRNGSSAGDLINRLDQLTVFQPGVSMVSTLESGVVHDAVFELTRVKENQMNLHSSLSTSDGQILYTLSVTDIVEAYHEFDTLAFLSARNNGSSFQLHDVTIDHGPTSGMEVFAETSTTLDSDSWQAVAPTRMHRLSPSHASIHLPVGNESARFLRLRCEAAHKLEYPRFVDRTADLGLPDTNSGFVSWVDFNNDHWPDLIMGWRLFVNNQGQGFTRIAAELGGLGAVLVAADFNNDGWNDLFSFTSRRLYRNVGGTTLVEVPLPEFPANYVSQAASWGDFNNDGFLDLYIAGFEDWNAGISYSDFLFLNQGDETFQKIQITANNRARGVSTSDFDRDGDLDIYVSNYRLQPNFLLKNNGNANFSNVSDTYNTVATSPGYAGGHSIGSVWGDFDNSGYFDLFAGNFAHPGQPESRFLRNTGPLGGFHFEDMGTGGVFFQESYASPAAGDFNNDGKLDLIFTTVYGIGSYSIPNFPVLFMNKGDFKFEDVTEASGLAGLPETYQAAWADFNNDGFLDLFVAGRLFENQGNNYRWLKVQLRGDGIQINRSAVGAQVRIHLGGETLSRQVETATGRGNQNDMILHFGLGDREGPFDLEIFWPDGSLSTLEGVNPNQLLVVDYPE